MRALVEAGTPVVSIFGKTWDLHVKRALGITEEENLVLISETVALPEGARQGSGLRRRAFLRRLHRQSRISPCARSKPRKKAGADVLCLCDTNGGTLTGASGRNRRRSAQALRRRASASTRITIRDLAVANTLAAVEAGATHVQGCMNGYGERCGNANLLASSPTWN